MYLDGSVYRGRKPIHWLSLRHIYAVHVEEDLALQGLCLLHRMNGKRPAAR